MRPGPTWALADALPARTASARTADRHNSATARGQRSRAAAAPIPGSSYLERQQRQRNLPSRRLTRAAVPSQSM